MVDVEKVKAGLKYCTSGECPLEACPYHESYGEPETGFCGNDLMFDALTVIEDQERHIEKLHKGIVRLRDAMSEEVRK